MPIIPSRSCTEPPQQGGARFASRVLRESTAANLPAPSIVPRTRPVIEMSDGSSWWQQGPIYQLLIPSFFDTNGDGIGDLPGIIARLDYLQWLGVRGIWLSPLHPSPLKDLGYDVADYTDVNSLYGSLADFDDLVAEAHRRDMRIVLDWVGNHTSDRHPWFRESRASRDNPKRDWYIWRSPQPDGSLPNNWISIFGGSVWEWEPATEQYYMHTFLPSQADLNWRNQEVQEAMLDVLRFWLDRGVDGFRGDATSLMVKDEHFRDNPPNPAYHPGYDLPDAQLLPRYTRNQPLVHEILAKCRRLIDSYGGDRMLAGELYLPPDQMVPYYGSDEQPELHLPFDLLLPWSPWNAEGLSELIEASEQHTTANQQSTWTLNTHDCERFPRRVSPAQTRVAAMLLYTLHGTPTHYYGEELGMAGLEIPPEHSVDPQGYRTGRNRDPARTPMQWTGGIHAGFTAGEPWLPVGHDRTMANVQHQRQDSRSLLMLYRSLNALRRREPVLVHGACEPLPSKRPLLVYRRASKDRQLLVALNLDSRVRVCPLEGEFQGHILLSTSLHREGEAVADRLELAANEGVIMAI